MCPKTMCTALDARAERAVQALPCRWSIRQKSSCLAPLKSSSSALSLACQFPSLTLAPRLKRLAVLPALPKRAIRVVRHVVTPTSHSRSAHARANLAPPKRLQNATLPHVRARLAVHARLTAQHVLPTSPI